MKKTTRLQAISGWRITVKRRGAVGAGVALCPLTSRGESYFNPAAVGGIPRPWRLYPLGAVIISRPVLRYLA